ncbi:3-phenylpropionate/cinnamic acid dioxygenase subunit beta [Ferviditalea candida]|uniref:3-phenylpropionate/cinnamic acid dioxygenase subunit beta n=1 Tax=Ferviditalea candida TaxID=3108399 RepID=A0ABU5ZD01_9BACL|nr:3-phenylpropionate/cinnamic acid dioxygenase subunit beta [Paenibacillaceae bacterium T2]
MNAELHYEISNFLYHEAYLLDHRQYKEWLDLLSEDLVYQMPIRVTSDNKDASNLVYEMKHFEETKKSLTTRVNRLYTTSAWVDNPATRQRHFVSNISVAPGSRPEEYRVRSYFLFKRSRASDIETEQLFGEREDVLRKENGEWKIASRTIYPDQAVLSVMNLGMFL